MAIGPTHQFVADLEAERRACRRAGVTGHEQVVFAFLGVGITHQPPFGSNRVQAVRAAGDELVRIDLMTGVPDEPILGKVERQMKRKTQLDDAEIAGEMRRPSADDADQLVAISPASRSNSTSSSVFRSAGEWIRDKIAKCSGSSTVPFQQVPGQRLQPLGASPNGDNAAVASSTSSRALRREPSTPSKPGYVHFPNTESLPTRLPSLVSSP